MAFTEEQESKLHQLLGAFENGQKVSDLPEVAEGAELEDMMVEVSKDGESHRLPIGRITKQQTPIEVYEIDEQLSRYSIDGTPIYRTKSDGSLYLDRDGNPVPEKIYAYFGFHCTDFSLGNIYPGRKITYITKSGRREEHNIIRKVVSQDNETASEIYVQFANGDELRFFTVGKYEYYYGTTSQDYRQNCIQYDSKFLCAVGYEEIEHKEANAFAPGGYLFYCPDEEVNPNWREQALKWDDLKNLTVGSHLQIITPYHYLSGAYLVVTQVVDRFRWESGLVIGDLYLWSGEFQRMTIRGSELTLTQDGDCAVIYPDYYYLGSIFSGSKIEHDSLRYTGRDSDQPNGNIWDGGIVFCPNYEDYLNGDLYSILCAATNTTSFKHGDMGVVSALRDCETIHRLYYVPDFWNYAEIETEYGISDFRFGLATNLGDYYGEPIYQLDFYVHRWEPSNLNATKKQVHIVWGEGCGILWDYSVIPDDFDNVDVEGLVYEAKDNADSAISSVNYLSDNVYTKTEINNKLSGLPKIVQLTQSEYDALANKDSNTLYVII